MKTDELYDFITLMNAPCEKVENLAVFIKNCQGRYVYANSGFAKMFGKSVPNIIGKRAEDLFPGNSGVAKMQESEAELISGIINKTENLLYLKSQREDYLCIKVYKFPIYNRAENEIIGIMGTGVDITSHVRGSVLPFKLLIKRLTSEQRQYLFFLSQGFSRSEIAEHMGIDPEKVKAHRKTIIKKFECTDEELGHMLKQYTLFINAGYF